MLFDPTDPECMRDPYPSYARLRESAPVEWNSTMSGWTVALYEDCFAILRDPRFVHELVFRWEDQYPDLHCFRQIRKMFLFLDGPEHSRIRRLIMPSFTPKVMQRLGVMIEAHCAELIENLRDRETIELVEEFSYSQTVRTICAMLGIPPSDDDYCHQRTRQHLRLHELDITQDELFEINRDGEELAEYFRSHVHDRRGKPVDEHDFISQLTHCEIDGDRLSDDDLLPNILFLYQGGEDTNANLLANATAALLRNPDQAAKVRADPSAMETGFDELLRYDTSTQYIPRVVASEPVEHGDVTFKPGDLVFCLLASANRDEARYQNGDRLDIGRRVQGGLGFGGGPHRCAGAALAKLQTSIALPALLRAFPDLEMVDDELEYDRLYIRGPKKLRLSLGKPA